MVLVIGKKYVLWWEWGCNEIKELLTYVNASFFANIFAGKLLSIKLEMNMDDIASLKYENELTKLTSITGAWMKIG